MNLAQELIKASRSKGMEAWKPLKHLAPHQERKEEKLKKMLSIMGTDRLTVQDLTKRMTEQTDQYYHQMTIRLYLKELIQRKRVAMSGKRYGQLFWRV